MSKQQEKAAKARQLIYFAVCGGVVGLLLAGMILCLAIGLLSKGREDHVAAELANKPADDGAVTIPPSDVGPVSVAPAVVGLTVQDLLASAVPPDDWSVTPDGMGPVVGAQPLFNAPTGVGHILQLAAPGTGHAALIVLGQHDSCSWIRYDLAKPPYPVGEVVLPAKTLGRDTYGLNEAGVSLLDLSPDGLWLAGAFRTKFVYLWGTDGQPVGRFQPAMPNLADQELNAPNQPQKSVGHSYTWLGFTDATHLAMLTDEKKLETRDVPTGVIASSTPVGITDSAVLSPGRKWLVGSTGDELRCLSVPDWKAAGTLRLPSKMPAGLRVPSLAFSPDGTRFAAYFASPEVQVLLTWDVSTGTLRDAVVLRNASVARALENRYLSNPHTQFRVQWTGPRTILLNGTDLVDLALGAPVYFYSGMNVRGAPDESVWQRGVGVAAATNDQHKKTREKLLAAVKAMGEPPARAPNNNNAKRGGHSWVYATPFFASRLPYSALTARLDPLRDKPMLHRYQPIRAEVAAAGPDAFREKTTAEFVEFLRRYKFVIDPKAPVALRLVLDRPIAEHRNMSYGTINQVDRKTGATIGLDTTFAVIKGHLNVLDSAGRVVWTTPVGEGAFSITLQQSRAWDLEAAAPEAVAEAREAFMRQFVSGGGMNAFKFGEVVYYDQGKPVILPLHSEGLPLDGVFDGTLTEPAR